MWNPFVDRVDTDSETLNGRSNRHCQLLDDNLKWQRRAEELAGHHKQHISELETNLEEKEVYISNIECMLADLSRRVSEMEGKLCRCHEEVEVTEVKDDNDPTSELSYEIVYHTPVAIARLLEDIPNRLVPIGDLEITRGGFEEEVRDGDEDSNQGLESIASQVAERVLEEEDENDKQVACVSRYWLGNKLTSTF